MCVVCVVDTCLPTGPLFDPIRAKEKEGQAELLLGSLCCRD